VKEGSWERGKEGMKEGRKEEGKEGRNEKETSENV
jgi:hypothetical protein